MASNISLSPHAVAMVAGWPLTSLSPSCSSYGGWVAPNIYYMGNAGVVRFGGLRIAGISGIYKAHDYGKGEGFGDCITL